MNIVKPEIEYREVQSNEYSRIINIPNIRYEQLNEDFQLASHLKGINELNLKKINGIFIRAQSEIDAIIAGIYCYKKYVIDNHLGSIDTDFHYDEDDVFGDFDDEDKIEEYFSQQWPDGTYCYLPILSGMEFINRHSPSYNPFSTETNYVQKIEFPMNDSNPYWSDLSTPMMINIATTSLNQLQKALQFENRFYILYESTGNNPYADFSMFSHEEDSVEDDEQTLNQYQKDFIFEMNVEFIHIPKPRMPYLVTLLKSLTESLNYSIEPSVDCEKVINQLMNYRKSKFESVLDIERIIHKALRYTKANVINAQAFNRLFVNEKVTMDSNRMEGKALKELNKLIGLTDVKNQLLRIVDRMKFTEIRKQAGYLNIDHHMAAVFMGNPGTAKTTIARIFGQLLFDSKVLSNNVFVEVSRKDLIGKYVGWTSHKVQEVFEKGKGGTIFIDEAYSLVNKTDGFSDEAFSAIIQNMENNPDTLVVFAGYTNEMIEFVRNSNPGLRSRLTNIIQFDDYDEQQLIDIFYYHVERAGFQLENPEEATMTVRAFIQTMNNFDYRQLGNGRLMRKLLSTSVGYMAQRKPKNINLLLIKDIEFGCKELFEAESKLQMNHAAKLGFQLS